MISGLARWLLWVFGIRDERVVCEGCGRTMWRPPQMSPQERYVAGDISQVELEELLERR